MRCQVRSFFWSVALLGIVIIRNRYVGILLACLLARAYNVANAFLWPCNCPVQQLASRWIHPSSYACHRCFTLSGTWPVEYLVHWPCMLAERAAAKATSGNQIPMSGCYMHLQVQLNFCRCIAARRLCI